MEAIFVIAADIVHAVLTRHTGGFMTDQQVSHEDIERATDYQYGNDIDFVSFHTSLEEAEVALSQLQETEVRGLFPEIKGSYPKPAKEILLERKKYFIMSLAQGQNLAFVHEQHGYLSWRIGEKILPHKPLKM